MTPSMAAASDQPFDKVMTSTSASCAKKLASAYKVGLGSIRNRYMVRGYKLQLARGDHPKAQPDQRR